MLADGTIEERDAALRIAGSCAYFEIVHENFFERRIGAGQLRRPLSDALRQFFTEVLLILDVCAGADPNPRNPI